MGRFTDIRRLERDLLKEVRPHDLGTGYRDSNRNT